MVSSSRDDDDDAIITFFRYFLFLGSGVHQKYVVWVLVGCRIKFHIQQALLLEIWVKIQSKIWTKKSSFLLWQICQINHYGWLIILKFYWFLNSKSQNLLLVHFHIRPILDPKFPLMLAWNWVQSRKNMLPPARIFGR